MTRIDSLFALEILDSRGRPTILAECRLSHGVTGRASLPSGASTGASEALELRDGDPKRHGGMGCLRAAANVNGEINQALAGHHFKSQAELDRFLIKLDGTPNKSRLGANAILAVSLAFCRAQAAERSQPLYAHLAQMAELTPRLPQPMINLFSGGAHGGGQVALARSANRRAGGGQHSPDARADLGCLSRRGRVDVQPLRDALADR